MRGDLFSSLDGNLNFLVFFAPFTMLMLLQTWGGGVPGQSFKTWLNTFSRGPHTKDPFIGSLVSSLFIVIIFLNLGGMYPYMFSPTTSLWGVSTLGLVIWGGILISGFFFNFKSAAAHLAPAGAPLALIPFLVLIETISLLIRPLTLTVRLVANISAGHIVMSLIANLLVSLTTGYGVVLVLVLMGGYTLFEFFVCGIQTYIFCLLITLYISEHP
uniref:ATP synthase F0 subunit 6 n=1 Tax=Discus perspectivus TaxID=697275 RepID=UPI002176E92F|nr:ATP synthase F0 subunit 6 [Discus perspectivus]UUB71743.1 ATP synthase F0 subunit 6 [Discus perspectivus]